MPRTEVTRDANIKEWAKAQALECLRKASEIERDNLFSEDAALLHSEAVQILREAGLSLSSIQGL